ncbi:MAG: type II secretion system GspH family protein [Betaproteobacteria bacterium]|nr:type II secretion system GspH family protein [Betaproteobacteria bacterium]
MFTNLPEQNVPVCRQCGFTFVELIATLAIMAVLAMVTVPLAQVSVQRIKEQELRASLTQIREALDAYKRASDQGRIEKKLGESGFPKKLDDLWQGVPDQRSPNQQKLYFLRSLPRDPTFPDHQIPAAQTWGLRSYASPPDAPAEGEDIFDVYSMSKRVGLNGVEYAQW